MRLCCNLDQPDAQLVGLRREALHIDQYTIALHALQDLRSRNLDLLIDETQLVVRLNARPHRLMQLQRDIGILCRILRRALYADFIKTDLRCALAADFLIADGLSVQPAQSQTVHIMAAM